MAKGIRFLKEFLTKNFENVLSDNELGALSGLTKEKDIIKEYGALPKYNITGDDLKNVFENKFRAIDLYHPSYGVDPSLITRKIDRVPTFDQGYSALAKRPTEGFSVDAEVTSFGNLPTLVKDASVLKGKTIVPFVVDRSIKDARILGVGGQKFENPVDTAGGIQFMDDRGFASALSAMSGKQKTLETIDMMGGKPVGMPVVMAERSSDFALDQSDVFLEMLKNSKMTRKQQKEMTDNIRSITYVNTDKETGVKTVRKPFTKAPPVGKLEEFSKYIKSRSGSDRAALIKKMDSKLMKDLGAPDIGHARLALTNPGLLAEDWLSMGGRFVDLDPKRGVFPSQHPSYDTEIARAPNAETYTFGTGVPYTIMLRKLMEKRRLEGKGGQFKPQSPDYKTIEMKPQNVEVVDQQLIDEASKYLEIKRTLGDEEAYKYAQSLIPAT
jgi:hypothetical protein